jgi:hypothetical protein
MEDTVDDLLGPYKYARSSATPRAKPFRVYLRPIKDALYKNFVPLKRMLRGNDQYDSVDSMMTTGAKKLGMEED